jgi:WD40 repeat protein
VSAPPIPDRSDPALTRLLHQAQHASPLISCRFSPCGKYVFAGAQDNAIVRWSLDLKEKAVLTGHKSWARALAFQGGSLYSADWAGRILAWKYDDPRPSPQKEVVAHKGWARALAVSPDGKTLASCGNDGLVKLWSVQDLRPLAAFEGHDCHVYNVAFHPSGKALASGDLKGNVKEWGLDGKERRTLDARILHKYDVTFGADIGGIRAMAFDPEGKLLACAGITNVSNAFAGVGNPLVVLLDWETGKQKQLLRPKAAFQGTGWGAAFHRGWVLGVGGGSGGAFWAWKATQPLADFTFALPSNARDLAMHPDGRRFAVPFENGFVRIYDMGPKG